jgi:hypothetical protein
VGWQTFEHALDLEPKSELMQACVAESRANVEAEHKWHNAVQNEAEAREKVSDPHQQHPQWYLPRNYSTLTAIFSTSTAIFSTITAIISTSTAISSTITAIISTALGAVGNHTVHVVAAPNIRPRPRRRGAPRPPLASSASLLLRRCMYSTKGGAYRRGVRVTPFDM